MDKLRSIWVIANARRPFRLITFITTPESTAPPTMPLFGPSVFTSTRAQKLAQRQSALDKATKQLSLLPIHPLEPEILKTPASQLAANIAAKDYSSLTVVTAFARRALETHNDLNALTEGSSSRGNGS
jgi:hypothetical protein